MFLATDIGNSNIVVAVFNGEKWIHRYRFESKAVHPELFYETSLRDLLLEWGIAPQDIKGAGISSVVPSLTDRITQAVAVNVRFQPTVLGPELFQKMNMHIPKVYEIGADLVANAMAVKEKYAHNAIIVDFGTALSFTVYEHPSGIKGVTIAPGLKTIISTLSDSTALLPNVDIILPDSVIGKSTSHAINAGVLYGFVGMVKELLQRINEELNPKYKVIATGGLSTVIKELIPFFTIVDKDLTLDGIRYLSQKQNA